MESITNYNILIKYVKDPRATWAVGGLGAIAEFAWKKGEELFFDINKTRIFIKTPRGSLEIKDYDTAKIIPYFILPKKSNSWRYGFAFCLPTAKAQMAKRKTLTELKPSNKKTSLFDLGLETTNVDCLICTNDSNLIGILRKNTGKPLFQKSNPALYSIINSSPNRIFVSRLAKIVVKTPIPKPGEVTKPGPHTHVFPEILVSKRTHSANIPIPSGYVTTLSLFPPNPISYETNSTPHFNIDDYNTFRNIYDSLAPPPVRLMRKQAEKMINDRCEPENFPFPKNQESRTALQALIRELGYKSTIDRMTHARWKNHFEKNGS